MKKFKKKLRRSSRAAIRRLRWALVYCLTMGAAKIMLFFPLARARRLGAALGRLAGRLLAGERRKVLENLDLIYGDQWSGARKQALATEVFETAGRSVAELLYSLGGGWDEALELIRIEGMEHAEAVFAEGRGAVGLTAHFGNWELLGLALSKRFPDRFGVVGRPLSNPWLNAALNRMRRCMGAQVFERGAAGREYVRFLREGKVLAILGDLDTLSGDGFFVDFMGRPAWTQRGIADLARLGKARILPAFVFPDPENPGKYVFRIRPAIGEPDMALPPEEWAQRMTQALTGEIERAVREAPGNWMWMHRRWRHRPGDLAWMKSRIRKKMARARKTRNER